MSYRVETIGGLVDFGTSVLAGPVLGPVGSAVASWLARRVEVPAGSVLDPVPTVLAALQPVSAVERWAPTVVGVGLIGLVGVLGARAGEAEAQIRGVKRRKKGKA